MLDSLLAKVFFSYRAPLTPQPTVNPEGWARNALPLA